jgi:O-antigen/teichoic acid export membrane protein
MRLKMAYKKLMQQVLFWVAPSMVILAVIAEPFFRFLFTAKWLPAVPYFQILCFAGIMHPLLAYNLNILKVKGRSDLFFRLSVIKKVYATACVFGAVFWFGIYGLLYFQVLSAIIGFVANSWYSGRLINYPMKEQVKDIAPILGLAALSGGMALLMDNFLRDYLHTGDLGRILITAGFYFLIYLSISYYSKMSSLIDFRQLILKR